MLNLFSLCIYAQPGGKLPFGQIPILETDGMVLAQSTAIVRFVADQVGK